MNKFYTLLIVLGLLISCAKKEKVDNENLDETQTEEVDPLQMKLDSINNQINSNTGNEFEGNETEDSTANETEDSIENEIDSLEDGTEVVIGEIEEKAIISFTVQVAASKVSLEEFSSIFNVGIVRQGPYIKYLVGDFETYEDATEYKNYLSTKYSGAFIQALKNGEPVHILEALQYQ